MTLLLQRLIKQLQSNACHSSSFCGTACVYGHDNDCLLKLTLSCASTAYCGLEKKQPKHLTVHNAANIQDGVLISCKTFKKVMGSKHKL